MSWKYKKGAKKYLSKENKKIITNIENLRDTRKAAINFFNEYTTRASETRCQAKRNRT